MFEDFRTSEIPYLPGIAGCRCPHEHPDVPKCGSVALPTRNWQVMSAMVECHHGDALPKEPLPMGNYEDILKKMSASQKSIILRPEWREFGLSLADVSQLRRHRGRVGPEPALWGEVGRSMANSIRIRSTSWQVWYDTRSLGQTSSLAIGQIGFCSHTSIFGPASAIVRTIKGEIRLGQGRVRPTLARFRANLEQCRAICLTISAGLAPNFEKVNLACHVLSLAALTSCASQRYSSVFAQYACLVG